MKTSWSRPPVEESRPAGPPARPFWIIAKATPFAFAFILCFYAWTCRESPEVTRFRWLARHGYIEVPLLVSEAGTFDVVARANGKPLRLMVDTGAEYNEIDAAAVEQLSLHAEPIAPHKQQRIAGYWESRSKVNEQDLAIGELRGNWEAFVFYASGLPHSDGLLGSDYLARHGAIIDYRTKKMFLWNRSQHSSDDGKAAEQQSEEFAALLKREGYLEVPLCFRMRGNQPQVAATIEGKPIRLDVDTGSSTNVLTPSVAERLHLPMEDTRLSPILGHHISRSHATLSIAGQTEPLYVWLLDFPSKWFRKQDPEPFIEGLLGAPFLRTHAAVIDYGSRKLYLHAH
jgi:predicted aspartyl protease